MARLNLVVPMLLARIILPGLVAAGTGRIVNVGSTFGSIAFPWFAVYSASKFGLRGFSQALRRELAGSGVGVTYVAPRAARTRLNTGAVYRMAEAVKMRLDEPRWVAGRVVEAIERERDEVYLGWPESLFVRVNALLPGLVDRALRRQTRQMEPFALEGGEGRRGAGGAPADGRGRQARALARWGMLHTTTTRRHSPSATPMRLLLVEDDRLLGDGLQAGLQTMGYTVDWVRDGAAAGEALATGGFDAMVLDLGLPRRDGLNILGELRRRGSELLPGRGTVQGDPEGLRVLLRNLLDKAVRYTPAGGEVSVRVTSGADGVALEVTDTGRGIPPQEREAALERFHRGEGVEEGGSGLGLSIVQRIAELHGACLVLGEPRGGRGLTVRVTFPAPPATLPGDTP